MTGITNNTNQISSFLQGEESLFGVAAPGAKNFWAFSPGPTPDAPKFWVPTHMTLTWCLEGDYPRSEAEICARADRYFAHLLEEVYEFNEEDAKLWTSPDNFGEQRARTLAEAADVLLYAVATAAYLTGPVGLKDCELAWSRVLSAEPEKDRQLPQPGSLCVRWLGNEAGRARSRLQHRKWHKPPSGSSPDGGRSEAAAILLRAAAHVLKTDHDIAEQARKNSLAFSELVTRLNAPKN